MKAILRSINNFSCKLKQSNNLKYNISPKIRGNKYKSISGNGNVVIEDALNKDLKDYKIYGNTKQQILPDGYTQVDYIQSNRHGEYINTNYYPTSNTKFELDFQFVGRDGTNNAMPIFGERVSTSSGDKFGIWVNPTNNAIALNFGYTDSGYVLNTTDASIRNVSSNDNAKLYYNNIEVASGNTQAFSASSLSIYLFALNNNGSADHRNQQTKVYSFKIYENNVLVRNLIPCYRNSDNEVGLYDLVNNVFYTNQGTGVFTYGSVAPTPDAPIDMVSCGDRTKNLFDTSNLPNQSELGISTSFNNSKIIIDGTSTKAGTNYVTSNTKIFLSPGTYTFHFEEIGGSFSNPNNKDMALFLGNSTNQTIYGNVNLKKTRPSITFTINESTEIWFYVYINGIITFDNWTIGFQLEEGSTATPYEPYGYKIPVNVRSDNLFDKDNANVLTAYIGANKVITTSEYDKTLYIKCKPNTTYTISKMISSPANQNKFRVCTTTDIPTIGTTGIDYVGYNTGTEITNITITTSLSANYLCVFMLNIDTSTTSLEKMLNSIQIVEGSTAPSKYIPYYNETTNIYLDEPLRKIDGYSDYIDFVNGKVVRKLGEGIADGSEKVYKSGTVLNQYFTTPILKNWLKPTSNNELVPHYCSHFINKTPNQLSGASVVGSAIRTDGFGLAFGLNSEINTASKCSAWLSSNPVSVDYVLATPTEEDIELSNINLVEGKNIITIGTEVFGVFEVEYYSKEIIDISNYKYNLRKVED